MIVMALVGCDRGGAGAAAPPSTPGPEVYARCESVATEAWTVFTAALDPPAGSVTLDQYDDGGWPIHRQRDDDDPDQDQIETWDRRADGQYERHTIDYGADGTIDRDEQFVFDADLAVSSTADQDGDGTVDSETTYAHDERGRTVRAETDDGLDGVVDGVWTATYLRDTDLVLTEHQEDDLSSGVFVVDRVAEYDALDRMTTDQWAFGTDPDDLYLYEFSYVYVGDSALPASGTTSSSGYGSSSWSADVYGYDEVGRIVSVYQEWALLGDPEVVDAQRTIDTVWTCP